LIKQLVDARLQLDLDNLRFLRRERELEILLRFRAACGQAQFSLLAFLTTNALFPPSMLFGI
jgi:hypothetical protein